MSTFDALTERISAGGVSSALEGLAAELRSQCKYHELFDALLMQKRHRLGLPVVLTASLDELAEPLRRQVEDAYLDACREVGALLLSAGQIREAWTYLRPVGEKAGIAAALERIEPTDENLQELIEIALYEGVSPARGYQWVLERYGTCNAITTYEGAVLGRPRSDQQSAAAILVRHLHAELLANVRADIARQEGAEPAEATLADLVADREGLFDGNNYHIDTTHLGATVRFARVLEAGNDLELAWDLTEYGRRLGKQFQYAGEEPFAAVYPSHGYFFAAQLGRQVDEAVAYFRQRAVEARVEEQGTAAVEFYVALLARLGKYPEAIDAVATLLPAGTRISGFAPSLLELSRAAGDYRRMLQLCRERNDLVGYAAALVGAHQTGGA